MNKYTVTGAAPVLDHEPGSNFDAEFTAAEEHDLLQSGRIQIVPRPYKVVGTSIVNETKPGGTFKAAFTIGQESALIAGGHIERKGA